MTGEEIRVPDLVASFQNAVVEALVSRAVLAAKEYGYDKLAIAGGVASNSALRAAMQEACDKAHIRILSSVSDLLHRQCSHDRLWLPTMNIKRAHVMAGI